MSQVIMNIINKVPDLPQHFILEFLGYKFHHGKYAKQLPGNLEIYDLLMERTQIINNTVAFDIKFMDHHNNYVVKTMEIYYSNSSAIIDIIYYAIEFDDSRHIYYK